MAARASCLMMKYTPLAQSFTKRFSERQRPAFRNLIKIGKHIQTAEKPAAMVVVSAHWEGGRDSIEGTLVSRLKLRK
jgi:aromatic ring-opening dioxygenase catalytic subunit (LigB family)